MNFSLSNTYTIISQNRNLSQKYLPKEQLLKNWSTMFELILPSQLAWSWCVESTIAQHSPHERKLFALALHPLLSYMNPSQKNKKEFTSITLNL